MVLQGSAKRFFLASSLFVAIAVVSLLFDSSVVNGAGISIGYYNSTYIYTLLPDVSSDNYGIITNSPDGITEWKSDNFTKDADGTYHWATNGYNVPGYISNMHWDLTLDADPTVSGFVGLTNNSGFVNTFTVTVNQPISPALPASVMNGSTAWTVTDGDNNGATLNATTGAGGDALYNAQVDGNTVRQLYKIGFAPLPLIAGVDDSASINTSFSGEITPVAANTSIGIFHHFTLTPNDSASATSVFRIVGVVAPEPSTLTLSLIGLAGMTLAYRRRR
jgi:hypothetical protein